MLDICNMQYSFLTCQSMHRNILSVLPFENSYFGNFRSVPGERVRFCPVPGA